MSQCSGNCSTCGGCGKTLELSLPEVTILQKLGQIPFLPVARRADTMTPVCLEEELRDVESCGTALQLLEKKGLISLDYHTPLTGTDMSAYRDYPVHGSMALTARGQSVLELLEIQGMDEL